MFDLQKPVELDDPGDHGAHHNNPHDFFHINPATYKRIFIIAGIALAKIALWYLQLAAESEGIDTSYL